MKKFLIIIVILSICYFLIGFVFTQLNLFDADIYFTSSAIIGGIASVSGLLAFTKNKIERNDIEKIGVEYFKKVVESAEELKKKEFELLSKEKELSAKEIEIKELDIKKQEMEFLIRKASMSLFLKDQLEKIELKIIEIAESKEFSKLLKQRKELINKIKDINEEVNKNPHVDLINKVIEQTKSKMLNEKLEPVSTYEIIIQKVTEKMEYFFSE